MKFKFKLNRSGVADLMKSSEMQAVLKGHASAVLNRANSTGSGGGYEMDSYVGQNRANAMVYADTYKARKNNLKHNTLLKALGG